MILVDNLMVIVLTMQCTCTCMCTHVYSYIDSFTVSLHVRTRVCEACLITILVLCAAFIEICT